MLKSNYLKNLNKDIPSGLVVFLVALPLCLGISLASGAPMFAGIIAGVVGGILVGSLSGSQLGVSGPAAGLSVIVAQNIKELGTNEAGVFDMMAGFQAFLVAGVIAGIIQIIMGLCKAGIIGYYFPTSVIKGMLAGIGATLIVKEIPHILGWNKNPEGDFSYYLSNGNNMFTDIIYAFQHVSWGAIIISAFSLLVLLLWQRPFIQKNKILSFIPGALLVVIGGILINEFFKESYAFIALGNESMMLGDVKITNNHLVDLVKINTDLPYLGLITFPDWSILGNSRIYMMGITIAIVASLETLLCVEATDKLDEKKRITPTNRELLAQGSGNLLSSLIGGLPVTQVIVRSSTNIGAGARTKVAAISHGIMLCTFVLLLPNFLNLIPLSCLAVILFLVGYKLARVSIFRDLYSKGMDQFLPFVITTVMIVVTNLLYGVGAGLLVAIFFILRKSYRNGFYSKTKVRNENGHKRIEIKLGEVVSFFNKGNLHQKLSKLPEHAHVIVDGAKSKSIDFDVLELLNDYKEKSKDNTITLELVNMPNTKTNE